MTVYIRESKRNRSRHVPLDNTVYRAIQRYAKEYHIKPGSDSISLFSVMTVNLLSKLSEGILFIIVTWHISPTPSHFTVFDIPMLSIF